MNAYRRLPDAVRGLAEALGLILAVFTFIAAYVAAVYAVGTAIVGA